MVKQFALLLALTMLPFFAAAKEFPALKLPDGFSIQSYAKVPNARSMVPVPELGGLFVSTRGSKIYFVHDKGLKGKSEKVSTFLNGLRVANGIAWKEGYLYIAEQHRISRIKVGRNSDGNLFRGKFEVLYRGLPDKSHHGWRVIEFGTDGKLYVAVGVACNICRLRGLEGTIQQFDLATKKLSVFATGVRNSVGLAFHPQLGKLYFTDNGADNMGDDIPPDELNRVDTAGSHFGFPFFGGGEARTRRFRRTALPAKGTVPPLVKFGAHVAPLGLHFYQGKMFPQKYRGSLFVAQHGSWNRSIPDGYRIKFVQLDELGEVIGTSNFIEGWLQKGRFRRWNKAGRPVDVTELPDGSLLVSDDRADLIYRVTYQSSPHKRQ